LPLSLKRVIWGFEFEAKTKIDVIVDSIEAKIIDSIKNVK